MERDRLLDQRLTLFSLLQTYRDLCVILGRAGYPVHVVNGVSIALDAVPDLAAQQLIHRQSGYLPGNVSQSDFDRAYHRVPRLECSIRRICSISRAPTVGPSSIRYLL